MFVILLIEPGRHSRPFTLFKRVVVVIQGRNDVIGLEAAKAVGWVLSLLHSPPKPRIQSVVSHVSSIPNRVTHFSTDCSPKFTSLLEEAEYSKQYLYYSQKQP